MWFFWIVDDEYVLVVVVYYIVVDGWLVVLLMVDLSVVYVSCCVGWVLDWVLLLVQYVDYMLWQWEIFGDFDDSDSLIVVQLVYWENVLVGMLEWLWLFIVWFYLLVVDQCGVSLVVDWLVLV